MDKNHALNEEEMQNKIDELTEEARKKITDNQRQIASVKGLILETIGILYNKFGVDYLYHFRSRVQDAETLEELDVARDMLDVMSKFNEKYDDDDYYDDIGNN